MIRSRAIIVVRNLLIYAPVLLLFCAGMTSVKAQNTNAGALTGTVTDPSGAAVASVAVTVSNQATGTVRTTTTTARGFYTVENLPDGDYTLSVTANGFSAVAIKNIHLDPGQRRG
jgi:Carboxypeptidase regulatory-like domain